MKSVKYAFAGNRAFVLEKMFELGLDIAQIWAVKGSYLEHYLRERNMGYLPIGEKEQFISEIEACSFEYFISNGLPVILPVTRLQRNHSGKEFINIHPSLLPQLRGRDPVPGALLFLKDSGASCHFMNEGIDTGTIISQVRIENTKDLDAGLLYQLSFMAEADAFELAYKRNFMPDFEQKDSGDEIYYSFHENDLKIDLERESLESVAARVRAFSTKNKGAYFQYRGKRYQCEDAVEVKNDYLIRKMSKKENNTFVMIYENKMIYKKENRYLKLSVRLPGGGEARK